MTTRNCHGCNKEHREDNLIWGFEPEGVCFGCYAKTTTIICDACRAETTVADFMTGNSGEQFCPCCYEALFGIGEAQPEDIYAEGSL